MSEETNPWEIVPRSIARAAIDAGIQLGRTAGSRPMPLATAVRWARYMSEQGHTVEFVVDEVRAVVWIRTEDPEGRMPSWDELRAAARPLLEFSFTCSPAVHDHCQGIVDMLITRYKLREAAAVKIMNDHHSEFSWIAKEESIRGVTTMTRFGSDSSTSPYPRTRHTPIEFATCAGDGARGTAILRHNCSRDSELKPISVVCLDGQRSDR